MHKIYVVAEWLFITKIQSGKRTKREKTITTNFNLVIRIQWHELEIDRVAYEF